MNTLPNFIHDSSAKMRRATVLVEELHNSITPLRGDLYELVVVNLPNEGRQALRYIPKDGLRADLINIMSDAMTNYRSALDLAASFIARTADPNAKPYFPVAADRQAALNDRDWAKIEAGLPGISDLYERVIRPAGGADEHIWKFASINNNNKHNFIQPSLSTGIFYIPMLEIDTNLLQQCRLGPIDAFKPSDLATGADIKVVEPPSINANLFFTHDSAFPNMSVLEVLFDIDSLVFRCMNEIHNHVYQHLNRGIPLPPGKRFDLRR